MSYLILGRAAYSNNVRISPDNNSRSKVMTVSASLYIGLRAVRMEEL